MSSVGLSVQDAATRLLCSEASIRRRIAPGGDLQTVPGAKPVLITHESFTAVQGEMLRRMGLAEPTMTSGGERVTQLEAEVTLLRGALADLTASNSAMLDTFRRLSEGSVPNN